MATYSAVVKQRGCGESAEHHKFGDIVCRRDAPWRGKIYTLVGDSGGSGGSGTRKYLENCVWVVRGRNFKQTFARTININVASGWARGLAERKLNIIFICCGLICQVHVLPYLYSPYICYMINL